MAKIINIQNAKKEIKIEEDDINKGLISLLAAFFLLVLMHLFLGSYSYDLALYADVLTEYIPPQGWIDSNIAHRWLDYHCPMGVSHNFLSFSGEQNITPEEFKDDTIFSKLFSMYKITASLSFALEGHWTFILVAAILIFIIIKLSDKYKIKIT